VTWRPSGLQAEHSWRDDLGAIRAGLVLDGIVAALIIVLFVVQRYGSRFAGFEAHGGLKTGFIHGPAYTFLGSTVFVVAIFVGAIAITYGWFLVATLPGRKKRLAWASLVVAVGLFAGLFAVAAFL
jgi:hypothetical protein